MTPRFLECGLTEGPSGPIRRRILFEELLGMIVKILVLSEFS